LQVGIRLKNILLCCKYLVEYLVLEKCFRRNYTNIFSKLIINYYLGLLINPKKQFRFKLFQIQSSLIIEMNRIFSKYSKRRKYIFDRFDEYINIIPDLI